jgi:hypothetical protein
MDPIKASRELEANQALRDACVQHEQVAERGPLETIGVEVSLHMLRGPVIRRAGESEDAPAASAESLSCLHGFMSASSHHDDHDHDSDHNSPPPPPSPTPATTRQQQQQQQQRTKLIDNGWSTRITI